MEREYTVKEVVERNYYEQIKKIIEIAIKEKASVTSICLREGRGKTFVSDYFRRKVLINNLTYITKEEMDEITNLYEDSKIGFLSRSSNGDNKVVSDSNKTIDVEINNDVDYDERSFGEPIRSTDDYFENNGNKYPKIIGYRYCIKVRGKEDLCGELSRDEMSSIHKLYTMYGASLTQREVSRNFPQFTFIDFRRILRAFNISKASIPIAVHELEENSEERNSELIFKNKEVNLLKKIESQTPKFFEDEYKRLIVENKNLRENFKYWEDIFSNWKIDKTPFCIKENNIDGEKKSLNLFLADMHIGANVPNDSIYQNEYNEKEVNHRFDLILDKLNLDYQRLGRFDSINVFNFGDDLDGLNGETTRGGHKLPQNMDNKEQFTVFINSMIRFFDELHKLDITNKINYYACTNSNHSGDFGFMANKALTLYLQQCYPNMEIRLFEKFIEHFNIYGRTYIVCHGKDKEDLKNGFPLTLNDKIENYIIKYMSEHKIVGGKVSFISADLHQTSFQRHRYFDYLKLSSFFGSSKWIHTNFGNTKAGTDYHIIYEDGSIKSDFIELN